jgi:hypothetical protein
VEETMGIEVLIPLFGIFSVILVPVLGVTVILTTRFALKPLAETIASAMRESGRIPAGSASDQVRELTEQVHALSEEVQRLREAQEFDHKLLEVRKD